MSTTYSNQSFIYGKEWYKTQTPRVKIFSVTYLPYKSLRILHKNCKTFSRFEFSCSLAYQIPIYMLSRLVARAAFWTFYGWCLCFCWRAGSLYRMSSLFVRNDLATSSLYERGRCLHRKACHFVRKSLISKEELYICTKQSAVCTEHFDICTKEFGYYESPLHLHGTRLIFYGTNVCLIGHRNLDMGWNLNILKQVNTWIS